MDLWGKLLGELVDIIEWTDASNDTLVWRFERYQNEIKNGAQLIVRQQQVAIFVNEGKIADVFTSGTYELETANLPILATLKGWKYGFNSPFKAEVYFVNMRTFTDNKWGTQNPIMLRDVEFGPIRIRAYGNFTIKVDDPKKLIEEIVGTDGHFTLEEIHTQLKTLAVSRFSDALAEQQISILDMAANYDELSTMMCARMSSDFAQYGLLLNRFLVENISLPPNVEEALDKRSSIGILGNLNNYTQYQAATAMEAAAKNPGGEAGAGIGLGVGFAMAGQLNQAFGNPAAQHPVNQGQGENQGSAASMPPPLPNGTKYFVAVNGKQTGPFELIELHQMIQSRQVEIATLVWAEGMAAWTKAEDVVQLKPFFTAMPPPLPGV